jgi:anaerobic magnesium-protoporphyrin IX monomethyl ester cyclase
MNILLVNPPRFNGAPVGREDRCENTIPNIIPPTGLVILAGLLEQKHNVRLIDANGYNLGFSHIEKEMNKEKPDFVIFKATPETFNSDAKVATIAKKTDKKIQTALICWSLTKIPHQVLERAKDVDYYPIDYNYERPINELCNGKNPKDVLGCAYREIAAGISINPPTKEPFNFDSLPMPAWHLIPDFSVYWVQVPSISPCVFVESMKGCGMTCSFCTICGISPTFRRARKVVDEIELLHNKSVKYINFFDATFNLTKQRVFEVCQEILKRKSLQSLRWFANVRADRLDKEEAVLMKAAGCEGVSIGVESGSQKVLDMAEKQITVAQVKQVVAILKKAGIKQYLSFIVGLPGENLETMNQTKQLILGTKPTGFQVNSLVPYPRTKVYDIAVNQGKINPDLQWKNLLLFNTPISLCELSTEQINDFRRSIYHDVYMNPGWWISNFKWVIKNPSDVSAGLNYSIKVARRLVNGLGLEI